MLKQYLSWIVVALALAVIAIASVYFRDMHQAYERIRGQSKVISSPYGDIEYAEGGSGPAVLVIHGSGGGFDQGELLARTVLGDRFHWIAPSRFGYLRSTFQPGATFDDQAHAYAQLLDHLQVRKAAVITLSHGGPSALLFAVLHPERVSSLTLLSAGVASFDAPNQQQANEQGDSLMKIFQQDVRYWVITKVFHKQFLRLMGVNDRVIAELTPEQRQLVDALIGGMNPVSQRAAGTVFDNRAKMPNERIAALRVPTLILHARDDTLQIFRNAEYAASTIAGSRLVAFDRGGHLLMAVEQPTIRTATQQHILAHLGGLRQPVDESRVR